jgi:hypothetical protein
MMQHNALRVSNDAEARRRKSEMDFFPETRIMS